MLERRREQLREELEDAALQFVMGDSDRALYRFAQIGEELAKIHTEDLKPIDPTDGYQPLEAA